MTERLERMVARATPVVVVVLHRYPALGPGRNRVAEIMAVLDARLRDAG